MPADSSTSASRTEITGVPVAASSSTTVIKVEVSASTAFTGLASVTTKFSMASSWLSSVIVIRTVCVRAPAEKLTVPLAVPRSLPPPATCQPTDTSCVAAADKVNTRSTNPSPSPTTTAATLSTGGSPGITPGGVGGAGGFTLPVVNPSPLASVPSIGSGADEVGVCSGLAGVGAVEAEVMAMLAKAQGAHAKRSLRKTDQYAQSLLSGA